jgi:hypothetical protein
MTLPPPSTIVTVYVRREPKTLNVLQVMLACPDMPDTPVQTCVFLPDRATVPMFLTVLAEHFETASAVLRTLGLTVRRKEREAEPVVKEMVQKTIERFRSAVASADGLIHLPTLNGRAGVIADTAETPASKLILPDAAATEEVTESVTPATPPAEESASPRQIEGLTFG